jgi:hypothetical protein
VGGAVRGWTWPDGLPGLGGSGGRVAEYIGRGRVDMKNPLGLTWACERWVLCLCRGGGRGFVCGAITCPMATDSLCVLTGRKLTVPGRG